MKKLLLFSLVLSFFILLIYASSENKRDLDYSSNDKNSLPQPLPLRSTPELRRLRTCAGDEFNCNLLDDDYTQCVKKYKICNQEIKCSNDDQLECPLCNRNYFYCDQMNINNKCIQLKTICFDSNELTKCSSNQTVVKNVCESFKLSLPNIPTTTILYDNITVTTTDNLTRNTDQYQLNKTTTDFLFTTKTTTEISYTTEQDTTNSSTSFYTTQLYNSTRPSLKEPTETTSNLIDKLTTTTELPNKSTTKKSTSHSTISSSSTTNSTQKPHNFSHKPKNILDYSKLFKQDYGGFNFSKFIYKANNKDGKFNYQSFINNKKGNNSSNSNFFDYSKFMGGNMSKGGSSDYSKYMNGMFDYSKFMGNQKSDNNDNKNNMMNYSKYMNQFTGGGNGLDYSKFMNNKSGFSNYSQFMKNGPKSKEWGSENYDYSKYKQSGINSSKSSGSNYYANDIKSGQKNQDKYAKNYFNYAGNPQNQPSNLEKTEPNLQNQNNVNQPQSNMFDYSKYIKQYSSSKSNNFFDYSKYMNQGGQKPNLKNSNLINLTGSRQPTRSFSSYFDYSKWLKPGGHQQVDEPRNIQKPKHVHTSDYLKNFSKKIIKFNEDRANQVNKQSEDNANGNDNSIDSLSLDKLKFGQHDNEQMKEPILKETGFNNNLEKEESNLQNEGYHHIEFQNQIPKFNAKQPTVNVSKIIPNTVSNKYNYTHYGSGVFFINFGTIVNGNNNINGDGNDVGNGNGNGNNNGNTQGDGMRIPELNNAAKPPPKGSSNADASG